MTAPDAGHRPGWGGFKGSPVATSTVSLELQPISFREACAFVTQFHRHHKPPQGHKFSIAAREGDNVVGVVIVGRPIARMTDDGWTAEVTRLATDGTKNACSILYAAAWRAARAMGYRHVVGNVTLDLMLPI